jgi:hypothetical protein
MSKISQITIEELLERYAAGQRDFTRFTIEYTDWEFENGIDLRGVKFRGDSTDKPYLCPAKEQLERSRSQKH